MGGELAPVGNKKPIAMKSQRTNEISNKLHLNQFQYSQGQKQRKVRKSVIKIFTAFNFEHIAKCTRDVAKLQRQFYVTRAFVRPGAQQQTLITTNINPQSLLNGTAL